MNLRDIEYILSAAELKNFARAAQRCHISQPSLSIQIKKVEKQLGQAIFIREQRGVRLSEFGQTLMPHLESIQKSMQDINALATDVGRQSRPPVTLGAISTVAPYVFPYLKDFERIILKESVTTELIKKLLDNEIDAALLALPVKIPFLKSLRLYREPFYLAGAKRNKFVHQINLEAIEFPPKCRFLILSEEHCMGEQTLSLCQLENRGKNDIYKATSLETLRQMAATSNDVTLIPALARRKNDGLQYRSLPDKFHRDIGIIYNEKNSKLQQIQKLYEQLKHTPVIQRLNLQPQMV